MLNIATPLFHFVDELRKGRFVVGSIVLGNDALCCKLVEELDSFLQLRKGCFFFFCRAHTFDGRSHLCSPLRVAYSSPFRYAGSFLCRFMLCHSFFLIDTHDVCLYGINILKNRLKVNAEIWRRQSHLAFHSHSNYISYELTKKSSSPIVFPELRVPTEVE